MTSLESQTTILTKPNPFAYGSSPLTVQAENGIFTNLTVGTVVVGSISITGPITQTGTTATIIDDPNLSAQTVGAVTVTAYTLAMPNNTTSTITFDIAGMTAGGDTLSIKGTCRAKNIGGVGSASGIFDYYFNSDAALGTASAQFAIVGTNIIITVTGVAAQTIRFSGSVYTVRTAFS